MSMVILDPDIMSIPVTVAMGTLEHAFLFSLSLCDSSSLSITPLLKVVPTFQSVSPEDQQDLLLFVLRYRMGHNRELIRTASEQNDWTRDALLVSR